MPIYMKFDGVDGESTSQGHENWIELISYSTGATRSGGFGTGGGGGAGKVSMQDFHFGRTTGKASPTLFLACCSGRHFPNVILDFTIPNPSGQQQTYLKYKLEDVVITSYQVGGDAGGARPTEQLSLNFAKITYSQTVPGGFEEMFWDKRTNTGGGGQ